MSDACAEIAREVAAGRIKGDRVTEKMIEDAYQRVIALEEGVAVKVRIPACS